MLHLPRLGEVVDGSLLTDEDSAESILYNRARGNILNRGLARITDNGDGSVNAYGAVLPAVQCDTLRLEINIQRLQKVLGLMLNLIPVQLIMLHF